MKKKRGKNGKFQWFCIRCAFHYRQNWMVNAICHTRHNQNNSHFAMAEIFFYGPTLNANIGLSVYAPSFTFFAFASQTSRDKKRSPTHTHTRTYLRIFVNWKSSKIFFKKIKRKENNKLFPWPSLDDGYKPLSEYIYDMRMFGAYYNSSSINSVPRHTDTALSRMTSRMPMHRNRDYSPQTMNVVVAVYLSPHILEIYLMRSDSVSTVSAFHP